MTHRPAILLGRLLRVATRLRGGGSAFPGMVVEKVAPRFLPELLSDLPRGVVVISGTNGKTTTTKIVTELLASQGLRVFTNRTGSNFARGIISAALGEVRRGRLEADIAVVELDEAHAVHFVRDIPPRHALLLNVLRDQMDRFGEVDTTARMLGEIAAATTGELVLNRDDARIAALAPRFAGRRLRYFGIDPALASQFPDDDALYGAVRERELPDADVTLVATQPPTYSIGGHRHEVALTVPGIHNLLNAAAAIALVRAVIGDDVDEDAMLRRLASVRPAFGRGERLEVDGRTLDLFLVKNPAGFRLSLASAPVAPRTMIAINDEWADGRDMSWLWDVDFTRLRDVPIVSGTRATDMALRLKYEQVPVGRVIPDLSEALDAFLAGAAGQDAQIFTTYTAMLELRRLLARRTHVEKV